MSGDFKRLMLLRHIILHSCERERYDMQPSWGKTVFSGIDDYMAMYAPYINLNPIWLTFVKKKIVLLFLIFRVFRI